MDVIQLMGGLGNQLWQYAFGLYITDKTGRAVAYCDDWYQHEQRRRTRPYLLDRYHIDITLTNQKPPRSILEKVFNEADIHSTVDKYYRGYWQKKRWMTPTTVQTLRNTIVLKPECYTDEYLALKKRIENTNSVAVHVRRGDYITHNFPTLPMSYYTNGLRLVKEVKKDPQVFVFSDDIEWCRTQFEGVEFVTIPEPHLALDLIIRCKTKIISNSTFSWWGAFLSPDSFVVVPQNWKLSDNRWEIHLPPWVPEDVYFYDWIRIVWS